MGLRRWTARKITSWLTRDRETNGLPLCDFDRISYEIRPCDILLIEGRSRVSDVIKTITQSPWTHSAMYIGRLQDIDDPDIRRLIEKHYQGSSRDQLIIEALLGEGTIVDSLEKYRHDHIRICRPKRITRDDSHRVIAYASKHLGCDYDVRQLLDLARFMFPYGILPRRWRSSLFEHNAGGPTRTVCSSLLAAAFASVHFPIIPVVQRTETGELKLCKRNFRLYTPRDFDYSPYFNIIKYPYLGLDDIAIYRRLPWDQEGLVCNDENDCYFPPEILDQRDSGNTRSMPDDKPATKTKQEQTG